METLSEVVSKLDELTIYEERIATNYEVVESLSIILSKFVSISILVHAVLIVIMVLRIILSTIFLRTLQHFIMPLNQ